MAYVFDRFAGGTLGDFIFLGRYVYLRWGRGILIEGKRDRDKLVMSELNEEGGTTAEIKAVFDGQTLRGTWEDKGKILKMDVKRT